MPKHDPIPGPSSNSSNSIELLYPADYKEHTGTRQENDRRLLPLADEIKSGRSIENLERFAKAYLGMYLDMDNSIPPADRIHILANPKLASLVYSGFTTVLQNRAFAGPEKIADSVFSDHLAEGYILLAALDLCETKNRNTINSLADNTVVATICYSYAYKNEIKEQWLRSILLQRPNEAIRAFTEFWQQLIILGTDHLPGIYFIIRHTEFDHISRSVLLPVLKSWLHVRKKLLRDLLRCALRTVEHAQLYKLAESAITNWKPAEPSRYMLWLACAFLLQPNKHHSMLTEYAGRTKEKLIPLLDFSYWVLHTDQLTLPQLNAEAYATLIRIIAAKITPQKDRYGELCDNTRKVMFLFYLLACATDKHPSIKTLLKVRVMKLYNPILEFIDDEVITSDARSISEQYDQFLKILIQRNLIQPRIKWSD